MSENLTRLAQKIDFSKTEDEYCNVVKKEGESSSDVKSEDDKDAGYQSSLWPWDSVRNKLRNALTEVSVLADVLTIAKEKRYMVRVHIHYTLDLQFFFSYSNGFVLHIIIPSVKEYFNSNICIK